jgi:hypothetical protein
MEAFDVVVLEIICRGIAFEGGDVFEDGNSVGFVAVETGEIYVWRIKTTNGTRSDNFFIRLQSG